ncbi:MAG TPA: hypothetical protein VGR41_10505 [Actinomycetota bacterium]|nr:hypothetical protein [Actinomycetota bacterium]
MTSARNGADPVGDDRDIPASVKAARLPHPHVRAVAFVGSRAAGTATPLSDWDFNVEIDHFPVVAADLPALVSGLEPLARQWDRLSPTRCYMLMLTGPAKVDLIFSDVPHRPLPPWVVTGQTLHEIDDHFWDWILWLASKSLSGKDRVVAEELEKMSAHLLRPMGVEEVPMSIGGATTAYRNARDRAESGRGVVVSRRLEREVLPVLPVG